MKHRCLTATLLCALVLTGCGVGTPGREMGSDAAATAEARAEQAMELADLLLAVATAAAHPESGAGWSGGWEECATYTGHEVEFRASGSFGSESYGRAPKAAVLAALRATRWRLRIARNDPRFVSFDVVGDRHGVYGEMVLHDADLELSVATGCIPVSGDDAERLVAADSESSDG